MKEEANQQTNRNQNKLFKNNNNKNRAKQVIVAFVVVGIVNWKQGQAEAESKAAPNAK